MASYFLEPLQKDTCSQTEAVVRMCSVKKLFLEILQNSQENTCDRVSYLINLQAKACNFIIKETLAQVLCCEFCEISKNTFFYRTPPVAASLVSTVTLQNQKINNFFKQFLVNISGNLLLSERFIIQQTFTCSKSTI